jgi:hypothetical protein
MNSTPKIKIKSFVKHNGPFTIKMQSLISFCFIFVELKVVKNYNKKYMKYGCMYISRKGKKGKDNKEKVKGEKGKDEAVTAEEVPRDPIKEAEILLMQR